MAKKSASTVSETAVQTTEVQGPLTREQKQALFVEYDQLDAAVESAKAAVKAAEDIRANHVGRMLSLIGAGPFARDGQVLKIVTRDGRSFFRGRGKQDVEAI